jgi:DNA-binding PadR family transcriptional regulator
MRNHGDGHHGFRHARGDGRRGADGFGEQRGPHGGRRRMFDHGELRLVVIALIAEQPRHGYEIIKAIEDRMGGAYSPSPGVIYPTLTMLEELGHATASEEGGKKQYAITDAGRAFLSENKPAVEAAMARMGEIGVRQGRAGAPPLVRAIENLRLALRLRMERGPLSDEQVRSIAAALDAAALAVERS